MLEHVERTGVESPEGTLPWSVGPAWQLHEAVVEAEVVPEGVLPALAIGSVVGEALLYEAVYVAQGEHLLRGRPDCHSRQRDVREGWLLRFFAGGR